MKTKLISIFLLVLSISNFAQSSDQNYIKTTTYKVPTATAISNPTLDQAVVQIGYFDGLGRPIQSIAQGQGADNNNIVTHIEYDGYGRQTKEFLPYVSGDQSLDYILDAGTGVSNFYNTDYYQNTTNPYSETLLENSPLNRVLKQAAPGEPWKKGSGHEIKFGYETNTANEVLAYKVQTTWNTTTKVYDINLINDTQYYAANQLYKNVTWDENTAQGGNEKTIEYKDKEGRVILKSVLAEVGVIRENQVHNTYYVYDVYGNLTYVLPPAVETGGEISQTTLDVLCYQYKYDHRNRLVAKKIPGKQWEYIVYDNLDRVRATGPVLSPFTNFTGANAKGWLITKYDAFNRPIMTGWMQQSTISETERLSLQNSINAVTLSDTKSSGDILVNNVKYRYNNASYPTTNYHILTINYYDNYLYWNAPADFSNVLGQIVKSNLKGMPTGSWVRVLETSTNVNGNLSYSLYKDDHLNTPIKSVTKYYTGGYIQTESLVDFTGEVQQTITKHKRTASETELVVSEAFTYSSQGRILTHSHQVNTNPIEFLAVNTYDALGQLTSKEVGGTGMNPLQTVDYKYNIRGWLTQINNPFEVMDGRNDDLFAFGIQYQNPEEGATPLFNGNISETYWKSRTDTQKRMYGYDYDGLNRLKEAHYQNVDQNIYDNYNEMLNYDKNGNITELRRNGSFENPLYATPIDHLEYFYDPQNKNLLKKVVDLSNSHEGFKDDAAGTLESDLQDDYQYDLNGNMISDQNKGISSILYNHLNLPYRINFGNGSFITYMYDATGVKLKKVVATSTTVSTTEYWNGFQYNNNVLQFFPHAEGYVNHTVSINGPLQAHFYNYIYQYKDHLGNIRMGYTWNDDLQEVSIVEENHYYPFGLKHGNYNETKKEFEPYIYENTGKARLVQVPNSGYQYQYNGKEWQDELGLNEYTFGWRDYDPAIGRFNKMDRFAEKYYKLTPYGYAGNNPILINEIQGDSLWISFGKNEKVLYENGKLLTQGINGKFSEYKGNQAKIDKKTGTIKGYNGFLGKAVSALNTLSSKSAGYDLVASIQESTSNLSIEQSNTGNRFDPNSNTVMFDPNSKNGDIDASGSTNRPSFIGLGHEMAHGLDDINGTLNTSLVPGYSLIREAEKFATHVENQLRNEHNLPLRTHYRALDSQGTVIESMPLLNGRIRSAHYPNFNYGALNSSISPAPAIIINPQIVPSVIINTQR